MLSTNFCSVPIESRLRVWQERKCDWIQESLRADGSRPSWKTTLDTHGCNSPVLYNISYEYNTQYTTPLWAQNPNISLRDKEGGATLSDVSIIIIETCLDERFPAPPFSLCLTSPPQYSTYCIFTMHGSVFCFHGEVIFLPWKFFLLPWKFICIRGRNFYFHGNKEYLNPPWKQI